MVAQGLIVSNTLDKENGKFAAVIKVDTSIDAPTVIYAKVSGKGVQWYPDGYEVLFLSGGKILPDKEKKIKILDSGHLNKLSFKVVDENLNGKSIMVLLTRKEYKREL
jgi:hypothetical protein